MVLAVVVLVVAVLGIGGYQNWQQDQNYQTGHAAYLKTDCTGARGPLSNAANGEPGSKTSDVAIKAKAELQECEALLDADAKQGQGKLAESVLAYSDVVTKYDRSPLKDVAVKHGQTAVAGDAGKVATTELCDALVTLEAQRFIATPDDTLPPLLLACGRTYSAASRYADALVVLARFRKAYSDHKLAPEVEQAFADVTLKDAATGAGDLPDPERTGNRGKSRTKATVVIQNDSPDGLSMVFSGPEVRVEDLGQCPTCEKYSLVGPISCPEKGPIGEYVVEPGTYAVVVKSSTGSNVTPFKGTWTLKAGEEYYSCFYIVTQ